MASHTVRQENTMVARVQLHNMKQDIAEPIRNFCARLRGQAGVCKFTVKCANCDRDVDYTEHMIRDVVTRGLADNDIQLDPVNCNTTGTLTQYKSSING